MRKNRRAFTLIELLVVLAIIAVVAALIIPAVLRIVNGPAPGTQPVQQQFTPAPFTPEPVKAEQSPWNAMGQKASDTEMRVTDLEQKVKELTEVVEQLKKQVNR